MSADIECVVGFAGFAAAVQTQSAELIGMLEKCYAGFMDGEPGIVLRAVVQGAPGEYPPNSAHGAPVEIRRSEGRIWLRSRDFDALVDLKTRVIQAWQPCALYPIDVCLKVAYTAFHPEHGGALFHASAVVMDGLAYLFCGPSGAGKSTISKLVGDVRLSDELVAVRRTSGAFVACGTPYWMGANEFAPLGGVFHLRQADRVFVTPLSGVEAASAILGSVEAPGVDQSAEVGIQSLCSDLSLSVPCGELSFNLDSAAIRQEIRRYTLYRHDDQVVS